MNQPNTEGIKALRELGESVFNGSPTDDQAVGAIATCGIVDLDKSVAAYHEAQCRAEEIRTELQGIETKIAQLEEELETLQSKAELLAEQEEKLAEVTPLDATDTLKILFSLAYEIGLAISCSRGYVEERTGISYYFLPFLERFILPALEGHLTPEWSADDIWATTLDVQITQRIQPYHRKDFSWANAFAELKKDLSPERLRVLVAGICKSEQCDADQLKTLIAQLRERAQAENWAATGWR